MYNMTTEEVKQRIKQIVTIPTLSTPYEVGTNPSYEFLKVGQVKSRYYSTKIHVEQYETIAYDEAYKIRVEEFENEHNHKTLIAKVTTLDDGYEHLEFVRETDLF